MQMWGREWLQQAFLLYEVDTERKTKLREKAEIGSQGPAKQSCYLTQEIYFMK